MSLGATRREWYGECTAGTSDKFYRLVHDPGKDSRVLVAHFGRRGSRGQVHIYRCATVHAAWDKYETLVRQKRRKGYVTREGAAKPRPSSAVGAKTFTLNAQGKQTPNLGGEAVAEQTWRSILSGAAEVRKAIAQAATSARPLAALESVRRRILLLEEQIKAKQGELEALRAEYKDAVERAVLPTISTGA